MKKHLPLIFGLLLAFYVVTQPGDAAAAVRTLGGGVASIANGFGAFLASLI